MRAGFIRFSVAEGTPTVTPIRDRNVQQFWSMFGPERIIMARVFHSRKESGIRAEDSRIVLVDKPLYYEGAFTGYHTFSSPLK